MNVEPSGNPGTDGGELLDLVTRPDWWINAACRYTPDSEAYLTPDHDQTIWFEGSVKATRRAVAICATCPVKKRCLASVLGKEGAVAEGIFGGLTGKQRDAMRRGGHLAVKRDRGSPHGTVKRARICGCVLCRATRQRYDDGYAGRYLGDADKRGEGGWSAAMKPMVFDDDEEIAG